MNERVTPARPRDQLTEDGRPVRTVLTYARRGSRFSAGQEAAWEAHHEAWVIPDDERGQCGRRTGGRPRHARTGRRGEPDLLLHDRRIRPGAC